MLFRFLNSGKSVYTLSAGKSTIAKAENTVLIASPFVLNIVATRGSAEYLGASSNPGTILYFGKTSLIHSIPFFCFVVASIPPIISFFVTFEGSRYSYSSSIVVIVSSNTFITGILSMKLNT